MVRRWRRRRFCSVGATRLQKRLSSASSDDTDDTEHDKIYLKGPTKLLF
jgi:hypothetical protein